MAYLALKLKQARDFPVACKVVLLPEKRFYVPGDVVDGKLIVSHRQPTLNMRGIKVSLQGTSFAKFKEREQIHHKTDTFLDDGVYVFGGPDLRTTTRLPAGTHSYPFQLQIPTTPQLPSTFKTSIGLVIYQVLAFLDIGNPRQFLKKGEKTIDVRGALEIGPEPPIEYEKIERSGGGEEGGPCPRYSFRIPTSGFVIGRDVEFEMRADNLRPPAADGPKTGIVSLVLKTTYYGGTVSRAWKDTYTVVAETVNNAVADSWNGVLPVGRQLATSFTGGVIEFRYLLRASLELKEGGGGTTLFKLERPVKVGTSMAGEPSTSVTDQLLEEKLSGLKLGAMAARGVQDDFDLESLDGRPGTSSSSLPRYSTLSLRSNSFETLPPEYDEVLHEQPDEEHAAQASSQRA